MLLSYSKKSHLNVQLLQRTWVENQKGCNYTSQFYIQIHHFGLYIFHAYVKICAWHTPSQDSFFLTRHMCVIHSKNYCTEPTVLINWVSICPLFKLHSRVIFRHIRMSRLLHELHVISVLLVLCDHAEQLLGVRWEATGIVFAGLSGRRQGERLQFVWFRYEI